MKTTTDNLCAAAHELGHAFVGVHFGFPLQRVIVRSFLGGGYCQFDLSGVCGEQWWHVGVGLAAGRASEAIYREDQGIERFAGWGSGDDEALFRQAAAAAGDTWPSDGSWESATQEAIGLLLPAWSELLPLIDQLGTYGQLDTALVETLAGCVA